MDKIASQISPSSPSDDRTSIDDVVADIDVFTIGGMDVSATTRAQSAEILSNLRHGETDRPLVVFTLNGNSLSGRTTDEDFDAVCRVADITHADGQSIVFASQILGHPLPERCSTTDFIHDASAAFASRGMSFYLLGGPEGLAHRCGEVLKSRYPGLRVVGARNGYFTPADVDALIADINASGADCLWVGLGVPTEQKFAAETMSRLDVGSIVTCGGCFNFVTGDYPRAPMFMQRLGFEWLFRLAHDPRRLLKRYLVTNTHSIGIILRDVVRAAIGSPARRFQKPGNAD